MSLAGSTATVASPVLSRDTVAADLGNVYTAISPTPGTGMLGHAVSTTLTETKAMFLCYNGGAFNIYPLYLRLTNAAVSVGNAQQQFTMALDQGNRFASFASGGAALTVNNSNMASGNLSAAQISGGAVVVSAASSQRRLLGNRVFRSVIGVAGDVYQYSFGSGELVDPSGLPTDGTNRANVMYVVAPVVIAPGCSLLLHTWGATYSTGNTFEYEFGFVEK